MRTSVRHAASLAAILAAISFAAPASAGIFDKINPVKAVKSVASDVGKTAKAATKTVSKAATGVVRDVGKTAKAAVKTIDKTASSVSKTSVNATKQLVKKVDKTATTVAHDVGKTVKSVGKTIDKGASTVGKEVKVATKIIEKQGPKVIKATGNAVGTVYSTAAKVADRVPILKEAAPLARDFSRAVRSKEGQAAGAAGLGLAIVTGGTSYAATQAGGWAYSAHKGKEAVKAGQTQVDKAKAEVEKTANDARREVRETVSDARKTAREVKSIQTK